MGQGWLPAARPGAGAGGDVPAPLSVCPLSVCTIPGPTKQPAGQQSAASLLRAVGRLSSSGAGVGQPGWAVRAEHGAAAVPGAQPAPQLPASPLRGSSCPRRARSLVPAGLCAFIPAPPGRGDWGGTRRSGEELQEPRRVRTRGLCPPSRGRLREARPQITLAQPGSASWPRGSI